MELASNGQPGYPLELLDGLPCGRPNDTVGLEVTKPKLRKSFLGCKDVLFRGPWRNAAQGRSASEGGGRIELLERCQLVPCGCKARLGFVLLQCETLDLASC